MRETKRDAILGVARDLFLERGFEGTSIDQIAEAARVSRQTIYNNFEGKEALFRALTDMLVDHVVEPLPGEGGDLESNLTALAERALALAVLPSTLALHRLVVAEAPTFRDLALQVYAAGAKHAADRLAAYLRHQHERGLLTIDDPDLAAEHFFGMLICHWQYRALLGIEQPAGASVRERAEKSVGTFLRAYGRAGR